MATNTFMTRKIVGCPSNWYQYTLALKQIPLPAQQCPCASTKSDERTFSFDSSWYLSLTRLFWPVLQILSIVLLRAPWVAKSLTFSIPSEGVHAIILRMVRQSNKCANTAHNGYVQNAGGCTLTLQSRKQFQKHRLYIGLAWNNEFARGPCICTNTLKESLFKTESNAESGPKET